MSEADSRMGRTLGSSAFVIFGGLFLLVAAIMTGAIVPLAVIFAVALPIVLIANRKKPTG